MKKSSYQETKGDRKIHSSPFASTKKNVFYFMEQGGIAILFLLLFYLFLETAILLGDDYYYAGYIRNGFSYFLSENKLHYTTLSGRIFIHFWVALLLLFDTLLYPLLGTLVFGCLILFAISLFVKDRQHCLQEGLQRRWQFILTGVLIATVLTLDITMLRETLLWICAFFNYVLPLFFTLTSIFLWQKGKINFLLFLSAFMAGASTEQSGVMSIFMICCYILCNFKTNPRKAAGILTIFFVIFGFCVVFFSPGTMARLESEAGIELETFVQTENIMENLKATAIALFELVFKQKIQLLSFLVFLLGYLLCTIRKDGKKRDVFGIILSICGLILIYFILFPPEIFFLGCCFILYCGLLWIYFLTHREYFLASLLLGAGASVLVVIPIAVLVPRVLFAFFVILGLLSGLFCCEIFAYRKWKSHYFLFGLFILTFTLSFDHLHGAYQNFQIEHQNLRSIKEGRELGFVAYRIDFDPLYHHTKFYENGFHYKYFIAYHHLEETQFHLVSEIHPTVVVNGKELPVPAIKEEGGYYISFAYFIQALGGSVLWSNGATLFEYEDYQFILRGSSIFDNNTEEHIINIEPFCKRNFYTLLYHSSVYEYLFPIELRHEEEEHRIYIDMK